jgi:putative ABC transport system permease protein
MGIPLIAGRDFNEHDDPSRDGVVIVSENLAHRFWPDEHPIGKRLKYGPRESDAPWRTVIGVVGNVRHSGLAEPPRLETYRPHAQIPNAYMTIVARTAGEPAAATASVQRAIWNRDSDQPVYRVTSMNDLVFDDIGVWGVFAGILTVLATIGLVLAAVGLYGVVSYNVSQRTREIGIRMALGARSSDVLRLVVTRSTLLTLLGLGVGVGLAGLLGSLLESLMYNVSLADPPTFVGVALLLILVALVATYLPARRATRVDPMVALRCE